MAIMVFLCFIVVSMSGIWNHVEGYTCTTSLCNCQTYYAECYVGYKDDTFPVISGGTGYGSRTVRIYGNKNITSFPKGTFSAFTIRISTLTITGTSITEFDCNSFQLVEGLSNINFSNNALKSIPSCALRAPFQRSYYSKVLDLQDNAIENVQVNDFINFTSVGRLNLKNNGISYLDPSVFRNLTSLNNLNLGNNKITSIDNDLLQGLTYIRTLSLQDNAISNIGARAFVSLTRLYTLLLNGNNLQRINPDWFSTTRTLGILRLQGNGIIGITDGALKSLCYLRTLDLSSNSLETFSRLWYNASCYRINLNTLYLSNNQISQIQEKAFGNLRSLYSLFLNGNKLTTLRRETFNGADNLITLILDENNIQSFEPFAFQGLSQLTTLSLIGNNLQELSSSRFNQLDSLRTLSLQGNQIVNIDSSAFQGLELLTNLNLMDNQLNSHSQEALRDSLVHLSELTILGLSGNPLTTLATDVFEFVHLEELYLANCQLSTMPYESLHTLLSLKRLDLSRNAFSKGDQTLSMISKATSLDINVSQNQLTALTVNISSAYNYFKSRINATVNNLQDVTLVFKSGHNSISLDMYLTDNKMAKPVVVKVNSKMSRFSLKSLDLSGNSYVASTTFPLSIEVLDSTDIWNPCSSDSLGDVQIVIERLTLDSNNLTKLTKAMCLGCVKVLELNNNSIQTIQSSVLHRDHFLCKTRSLSLKGNQLSKLSIVTLRQLCGYLGTVNLQDNVLGDLNKLKSIQNVRSMTVQMSGNPIHCGCDILWYRSSQLRYKLAGVRCSSPDYAIGYTPNCFPDYSCSNHSSPTSSACAHDMYISVYKLSLEREGNSLKVNWAAFGPGQVDHFVVSRVQTGETTSRTVVASWNVFSTILDDLDLDVFRYNICVTARGSKVAPGTGVRCSEVDFVAKPNDSNVSTQPPSTSPQEKLNIGLGVSLGIGIPAIISIGIGVVYYRRKKLSITGDLTIKYISTEE